MIALSRDAYDDIVYHAYTGGDEEVCGLLAGEYGDGESRVHEVRRAENAAETPQVRYRIDPREQFEMVEAVESAGLDIVGFYHSHPSGPTVPSETDLGRATWPDRSYVICALDGYPFVGSWRYRDDGAFEQETVTVPDTVATAE
jgi:proteasome lid subunit RPN8/RPN11